MSKHNEDELPAIEAADLAEVSGGNHKPGHIDPNVAAAVQSITSSLSAVQKQNQPNNSLAQVLPLLALAKGGARGGCPGGNCLG